MSVPIDLRRRIEEDIALIEAGEETYRGLAKRHNVKESDVYRIHQEKRQKMRVEGAKDTLEALEEKIGKRREEFKALDDNYRERKAVLEGEIKGLEGQKRKVKDAFESQGLSWAEGVCLVAEISNLRGEKAGLQKELSALRVETKRDRSVLRRLKTRLSDLRGCMKREEGRFHNLLDQILSAQGRLYAIKVEERQLAERAKNFRGIILIDQLGKRKASLQAEIQDLTAGIKRLSAAETFLTEKVNHLKAERDSLQLEREERIKKAKELAERIVADAEEEKKRILAGAEEKKEKTLKEAEELKKLKGRLEAEIELVRAALKDDVQKLRKKPETQQLISFRPGLRVKNPTIRFVLSVEKCLTLKNTLTRRFWA